MACTWHQVLYEASNLTLCKAVLVAEQEVALNVPMAHTPAVQVTHTYHCTDAGASCCNEGCVLYVLVVSCLCSLSRNGSLHTVMVVSLLLRSPSISNCTIISKCVHVWGVRICSSRRRVGESTTTQPATAQRTANHKRTLRLTRANTQPRQLVAVEGGVAYRRWHVRARNAQYTQLALHAHVSSRACALCKRVGHAVSPGKLRLVRFNPEPSPISSVKSEHDDATRQMIDTLRACLQHVEYWKFAIDESGATPAGESNGHSGAGGEDSDDGDDAAEENENNTSESSSYYLLFASEDDALSVQAHAVASMMHEEVATDDSPEAAAALKLKQELAGKRHTQRANMLGRRRRFAAYLHGEYACGLSLSDAMSCTCISPLSFSHIRCE